MTPEEWRIYQAEKKSGVYDDEETDQEINEDKLYEEKAGK